MRHTIAENINILGKFDTGDTVTISLYDLSDNSSEPLSNNECVPIGSTGVFKWNSSNIQTAPAGFVEFLWIMDNGTYKQYGKIVLGGYPDSLLTDITFIKDIEGGDWERIGVQMIFYKPGGAEIARFNLFKFDGTPATESDTEVAKRERV